MIFIYIFIPSAVLLIALIFSGYKKEQFRHLDNKEHPLRFLYPAAARIYDALKIFHPKKAHSAAASFMKQLCVRENVESELYVYNLKKISSYAALCSLICIVGMLLLITSEGTGPLLTLNRSEAGGIRNSYELNVEYGDINETIELDIDPSRLTPSETLAYFDEKYDGFLKTVLADNESPENVSSPLSLVDTYENIEIEWQIEDTSLISYNGEINSEIDENEFIDLSLYATFSLNDVTNVYCIPVTITGKTLTEKELLIQNINEAIEKNNSVYDSQVVLPDEINGKSLTFTQTGARSDKVFFALGIVAVIVVGFGFDQALKKKAAQRRDELAMDFSEIVFKLNLLCAAGLSISRAWEKIVKESFREHTNERFAYKEMQLTLEQIKNGASESHAYGQFGKRCGLHRYIKLGNILEQNLSKGSRGMKDLLSQEVSDAFEERKRIVLIKSQEAGTKLMFPMMIMLAIVIIIVAVPALLSISF